MGNHDAGVLERYLYADGDGGVIQVGDNRVSTLRFRSDAYEIVKAHRRQLQKPKYHAEYTWLEERPLRQQPIPGVYLAHGSYSDVDADTVWDYGVKNESKLRAEFENMLARVANIEDTEHNVFRLLALGHFHIPGVWQWDAAAQSIVTYDPLQDNSLWNKALVFEDLSHAPIIVSPGSLSLPRVLPGQRNHGAYLLLRLDDAVPNRVEICFQQSIYDWEPLHQDLMSGSYPRAERLMEELVLCSHPNGTSPQSVCFEDEPGEQ
ncbi:MAG: hypothetical protein AAF787_11700 [Chloroflexota bacterium]